MKIEIETPKKAYVKVKDLKSGECGWVEDEIGSGDFSILIMRLGYAGGIKGYVSLETGFGPPPNHYLAKECLDWNCIPANVKIVEGD